MDDQFKEERARWAKERLRPALEKLPGRKESVETDSGIPVEPLYLPFAMDYPSQLGFPGEPPFTRGVYPAMYRNRHWTMRQYAGFGTA